MKLTQELEQQLAVIFGMLASIVCVATSALSYFTVPQDCDGEICSIHQLIYEPSLYGCFLLSSNGLLLLMFLYTYYFELKREFWLIENFDYTSRYSEVHLATYKDLYPTLFSELNRKNIQYNLIYRIMRGLYIVNLVISGVILFFLGSYYDYRSITTFATNNYITWTKISNGLKLTQKNKGSIGYSYYNMRNLSFNRIDDRNKTHISAPASLNGSINGSFTNS